MAEDWTHGGFGLYIHWPFCESKCPYCDFNSHVRAEIDEQKWRDAYLKEIDRYAIMVPDRVLNSVFFGGGTPSLMSPDLIHDILDRIQHSWPSANDLEVTLEANPSSVEASRFAAFAQTGVSRVSMGVQALNDVDLKRLGRLHTVAEAQRAFDVARRHFERVSFDLIYARQDQSLADWRAELSEALQMAVDHLSLYQLTIEPGTAFFDRFSVGRLRGLPNEDLAADMFELTQELCDAAGFQAYEVSNHAKIGSESRHNLIYWRYGDYIGIGPGAHGRLTLFGDRHAIDNWSNPERWLEEVSTGNPEKSRAVIPSAEQASEMLMMGLRVSQGVDLGRYRALADKSLCEHKVSEFVELNLLKKNGNFLSATSSGRSVLNAILRELLPD